MSKEKKYKPKDENNEYDDKEPEKQSWLFKIGRRIFFPKGYNNLSNKSSNKNIPN